MSLKFRNFLLIYLVSYSISVVITFLLRWSFQLEHWLLWEVEFYMIFFIVLISSIVPILIAFVYLKMTFLVIFVGMAFYFLQPYIKKMEYILFLVVWQLFGIFCLCKVFSLY